MVEWFGQNQMHQDTSSNRTLTTILWMLGLFVPLLGKDPQEMHYRCRGSDYQKIIQPLKAELKKLRQEIGDIDQEHPGIREIINAHRDD